MNKKQYVSLIQFFSKNLAIKSFMTILTKYSPIPVMVIFGLGAIYCLWQKDPFIWKYLFIPLSAIIIVTILRKTIYVPRPFIRFQFEPLIPHLDSSTFPSKHTTSAFIISYTIMHLNYTLGCVLFVLAIIIGVTRIIAGIHRPFDIISGFVLATILSMLL